MDLHVSIHTVALIGETLIDIMWICICLRTGKISEWLLAALMVEVGSKAKTLVAFFTRNLDFLGLLYTRGP